MDESNETKNVDLENNEEVLETEEGKEEEGSDKQDQSSKRKFTDEEQLAIHKREAKKLEKKLGKNSDEPKPKSEEKAKSSDVDYGQLAYLNSKSVAEEDHDFVLDTAKEANMTLKELLSKNWFKSELAERAEGRASEKAVPSKGKRSSQDAKDSVDYWTKKYSDGTPLNDIPSNMRTKVLNARIESEKSREMFSDNPIIIGGMQQ